MRTLKRWPEWVHHGDHLPWCHPLARMLGGRYTLITHYDSQSGRLEEIYTGQQWEVLPNELERLLRHPLINEIGRGSLGIRYATERARDRWLERWSK